MPKNYCDFCFDNKVVLITGGASGIGREVAEAFVSTGAKVVVGDVDQEALDTLRQQLGGCCEIALADVTNELQVEALVNKAVDVFGGVDIAVNCAGGGKYSPLLEMTEKVWNRSVDLNLKSVFLSLKHQGRQMRAQGQGGVIINITSVTGSLAALGLAPYSCGKKAAEHLTRIAAEEFAPLGIRVVALSPGLIRTRMTKYLTDNQPLYDQYMENVSAGRIGEVEEVAHTVLFLASGGADYINGSVVRVDGGHYANGEWCDLAGTRDYYEAG